jgi:putative endonuclease
MLAYSLCRRVYMRYYFTYVLISKKDGKYYIGWTDNVERRLIAHNLGKVDSTKSRKPFELIYYEACLSKKKAIDREKQLKTGFGRKYIKSRI